MSTVKVQNEDGSWVDTDYTSIDDPFDTLTLTRDESSAVSSGGSVIDNANSGSQNDTSESVTQIGSQLSDLTISNSIKSTNYIPASRGFLIDGSTGIIECSSIRLTGGMISYGKTSFIDSAHSGYYIGSEGVYFGSASDATKFKFSVATGALEYAGNLVNGAGQIVMNSVSQEILKDFDFGTTDFAGAVKTGDITWNSLGVVTGGTGVAIYRGGIVGAASGTTTFAIDATTGNAIFSGSVMGSTITGGTLQTSATGQRIRIVSAIATDPAQAANSLALIALDGGTPYCLLETGSDNVSVLKISMNSATIQYKGFVVNRNSGAASGNLIEAEITNTTDSGTVIQATGYGSERVVFIRGYGGGNSPVMEILHAGDGGTSAYGLKISSTTNANAPGLYVEYDANFPGPAVKITNYRNNNFGHPLTLENNDSILSHFKKMIEMVTCTIWISDGTSPDGVLGYEHVGDICLSCDSGKTYYATGGSDDWTAM